MAMEKLLLLIIPVGLLLYFINRNVRQFSSRKSGRQLDHRSTFWAIATIAFLMGVIILTFFEPPY